MLINNAVITGSFIVNGVSVTGITGSSELSSSYLALSSSYLVTSASYAITSASYAQSSASLSIRTGNLEATSSTLVSASSSFAAQSASLSTRVTNLEVTSSTVSSSFATTSGSLSSRVTIIEGQDATTGSNVFTGTQYISQASNAISFTSTASLYTDGGFRVAKDSFVSGTAYFNNITVYGTSSIEYITSSQVNIGSNVITVNTDTPAIRFGGLSVFDSGSTQLTGSLFWDSEKNHWIYSNPSGSSYNSAMLMNGPRNTGSLGTEQGTLNNYVMKGQGGDHITSSQMIDDGTTVMIPGALQVTGSTILSSALSGTSATFSGTINANSANSQIRIGGATTDAFIGVSTSTLYLTDWATAAKGLTINLTTGAATFSSSVQSNTNFISNITTDTPSVGTTAANNGTYNYTGFSGYWGIRTTTTGFNFALDTYNGGTPKNVLTITQAGNVGIGGTVPNTWNSIFRVLEIGNLNSSIYARTDGYDQLFLGTNHYYSTGGAYLYANSGKPAQRFYLYNGEFVFQNAPSGTAGSAITWAQPFTIASSGAATFSSSVTATDTITVNSTANAGLNAATNSTTGYSFLNLVNNGASGKNYQIGIGGNGAPSAYANNLYIDLVGVKNIMTITPSGNVGIGVTSPSGKLDVRTSVNTSTIYLGTTATSQVADSGPQISFNGYLAGDPSNNYPHAAIRGAARSSTTNTNGGVLLFYTSEDSLAFTEKMRITSEGNVGIGTLTPDERLTVGAGNGISIRTAGSGNFGSLKFGTNVSAYYDSWAGIDSYSEDVGANVANLRFYTSYGARGERMRITGGGNFYVYSMAASAGTNAVKFNTSTGQVTYDTSSSRYKDNIRDSIYGLNTIMQLKSKTFEYKEDSRTDIGLIAEEVYEVIPELVGLDKEGLPNSVSYDRFVSVLVKAVQELSAKVDAQAAEINELKNK
jgi:hypothetical protein